MASAVTVPTTVVSERTWSVSQVERWPDPGRFEILDGVLYMTAMPRSPHPEVVDNLDDLLGPRVRRRRLGRVLHAQTGIYLNEVNYLDPDLVFVRREQMPARGQRFTRATLAGEVLSPSNRRAPREQREELFHAAGVEEPWYVDPAARVLEVRRRSETGYETTARFQGQDLVRTEVLPGFEFPLTALWEDLGDA